jgi:hypothetical protein
MGRHAPFVERGSRPLREFHRRTRFRSNSLRSISSSAAWATSIFRFAQLPQFGFDPLGTHLLASPYLREVASARCLVRFHPIISDLVALNPLAVALLSPLLDNPMNQRNNARFTFLSPASRNFYPDWEHGADSLVASMRNCAGKNPHDKDLTDLIGELVTRSDEFRNRWTAHNVRFHRAGVKRLHHPEVGDLEFEFEGMELPGTPGWMLYAYTTVPGSPTEERVALLGSLAATRVATRAEHAKWYT